MWCLRAVAVGQWGECRPRVSQWAFSSFASALRARTTPRQPEAARSGVQAKDHGDHGALGGLPFEEAPERCNLSRGRRQRPVSRRAASGLRCAPDGQRSTAAPGGQRWRCMSPASSRGSIDRRRVDLLSVNCNRTSAPPTWTASSICHGPHHRTMGPRRRGGGRSWRNGASHQAVLGGKPAS